MDKNQQFLQRMINKWSHESNQASMNGDYKAFQKAEQEKNNYKQIMKNYFSKIK